ncbi:MAG: YihY/virulence factor BrkB family protein [Bdellovibrionota bacterium]
MNIHKKLSRIVKKINRRPRKKEIDFYHKKNLKLKSFEAVFRELIFILKHSYISAKSAQITYTFILAIIPFLSILFTFIHSFHGFENIFASTISPLIKKHFGSPVGIQISNYLQTIIKNIQVKELGIISFITFSITVIMLLLSIEDTFNDLMQFRNHKTFFQRFIKCWTIITISPFLFALTAVKSDPLFHLIRENSPAFIEGSLIKTLRFFLGISFQALYFIFLYYVMPSKRLHFKSVLLGGIVASIFLELLQFINIFIAKSTLSADPSRIYGTVPLIAVLFFAWIRLGWIVTLVGAATSLAAQRIFYFKSFKA